MTCARAGEATVIIDHTAVSDALRGRGVGLALGRWAVEDAPPRAAISFPSARSQRHRSPDTPNGMTCCEVDAHPRSEAIKTMSWSPGPDPTPGDRASVDALEAVIVPRAVDLGAMEVRRALPSNKRQMVGPFIFFDQMAPAEFLTDQGSDVRPHPHINLATLTHLFEGQILHRDSLGTDLAIKPGAVNWMKAGRGIVHSDRTAPERKATGQRLFGIQTWMALLQAEEESEPAFVHHGAGDLPTVEAEGLHAPLIARSAFGATLPLKTASDTLYADVTLAPGARAPIAPDADGRAYVAASKIIGRRECFAFVPFSGSTRMISGTAMLVMPSSEVTRRSWTLE